MNRTQGLSAATEWRQNWSVALASMFGAGVATFHVQSVGPLIRPLGAAFGWTRAQASTGLFIVATVGLIMTPAIGWLIDRLGARPVALTGVWAFGIAIALVGLTGPALWTWYLAFTLLAIVGPSITSVVWSKAIVDRFDRARGMALGVMRLGLCISGGAVPVFMTVMTGAFGWRWAYVGLGAAAVVIAFPAAWLWFYDGRRSTADVGGRVIARVNRADLPGMTVKVALRDSRFWRLGLSLFAAAVTNGFFVAHLQPLLIDGGISPMQAALATGALGVVAGVAALAYGALADRMPATILSGVVFGLPILACILLLGAGAAIGMGRALAVVVLIGASLGSEGDSMAYLVGRFFGLRSFGVICGLMASFFAFGYGLGPVLGGLIFDSTGSYKSAMLPACCLLLLSVALVTTLGRYPDFSAESTTVRLEPAPDFS
jgi:MFS family permease